MARVGRTMKRRVEEVWAREFLERVLKAPVDHYDDGSRPGMFDLLIRYSEQPAGAAEVTTATDPKAVELQKLVNPRGQRWEDARLKGGWVVNLNPEIAKNKSLVAGLPELLEGLERNDIDSFDADFAPTLPTAVRAKELGLVSAWRSRDTSYPGSIYPIVEQPLDRIGGWVSETSNEIVDWIEAFSCAPEQRGNLEKLARHRVGERHLFVIIPGFGTAPFAAFEPLTRAGAPAPTRAPAFPRELTNVWIAHVYSRSVFEWSTAAGWTAHAASV